MERTVEDAIARAKAVYEQVTGRPAPESLPTAPYARIPPEVDPEEFVTRNAAALLAKVQTMVGATRPADPQAGSASGVALRALPIPACLIQANEEMRLVFEMPGVPRSAIEVELQGATIRVSAERPPIGLDSGDKIVWSDFGMGRVERVLALPFAVDPSTVSATMSDGLLTVRIRTPMNHGRGQKIEVR